MTQPRDRVGTAWGAHVVTDPEELRRAQEERDHEKHVRQLIIDIDYQLSQLRDEARLERARQAPRVKEV